MVAPQKIGTYRDDSWASVLSEIEARRNEVSRTLHPKTRTAMGQFFTPIPVACFMADTIAVAGDRISMLDPGAGIGVLSAALVSRLASAQRPPARIDIILFDLEAAFGAPLRQTMEACQTACESSGIHLEYQILNEDFICSTAAALASPMIDR